MFRNDDIDEPYEYLKKHYVSLILLGVATVFRTTGIFISAIYGIPIIQKLMASFSQKQGLHKSFKIMLTGFMVLAFFLTYTISYLYRAYTQFCIG